MLETRGTPHASKVSSSSGSTSRTLLLCVYVCLCACCIWVKSNFPIGLKVTQIKEL